MNLRDAIIFKSTNLRDSLQNGLLPNMAKAVGEVSTPRLVVGNSAFPPTNVADETLHQCHLEPKAELLQLPPQQRAHGDGGCVWPAN